ncbi:SCO5389 family protein [Streptomyces jietaisiensis]|uniref:SCO5389 family protein n=1 Tax=Streptomyces griseoaurantiacus TaxID=68213 RepID=UPI00324D4E86
MSSDVTPRPLADAGARTARDEDVVAAVRASLPYAYRLVAALADELRSGTAEFADAPAPSEAERGQVRCALSSEAIRGSLERHFGVVLAS